MAQIFISLIIFGVACGIVGAAKTDRRWAILQDRNDKLEFVDLTQEVVFHEVDENEVTFYYSSSYIQVSTGFHLSNASTVIDMTDFDPKRRTMFIVHGWNNDRFSPMNILIPSALKAVDDWNIFVVDWSGPANAFYTTSRGAVPYVGNILADFIRKLSLLSELSPADITLVGHSLGAHVCGQAGSVLGGEISVIVGMDPAWPLFYYGNLDERLDPSDGRYVQIIHTNGGELAFQQPLGHSDFYPNGGHHQAGCGLDWIGLCAHSRSYMYFSESIVTDNFRGTLCDAYENYKEGNCKSNTMANMGGNYVDTNATGLYFLDTADEEPFALG